MPFNLKKVLKALLLSSSQPLAIKDIQAAFTRFHEQAAQYPVTPTAGAEPGESAHTESAAFSATEDLGTGGAPGEAVPTPAAPRDAAPTAEAPTPGTPTGPVAAPLDDVAEVVVETSPQDPELYAGVPALITGTQIRETMDQIAAELRASDEGLLLIEGNAGYRLVTHPRFARWVRILRQEPPPVKLSQSAIETLAVVAYRQPVTRGEIETIRGVSAEAGINKLIERELVYIVGRADAPGRPIQYGTTDQFLEFIGIKSLDELPASDVLSSRQINDWLKTSSGTQTPTDTDMGLPDEQLPLEAVPPAPTPAHETPADETLAPAFSEPEVRGEVRAQN